MLETDLKSLAHINAGQRSAALVIEYLRKYSYARASTACKKCALKRKRSELTRQKRANASQMSIEESFNTFLLQRFYTSHERACHEHMACGLPLTETMRVKLVSLLVSLTAVIDHRHWLATKQARQLIGSDLCQLIVYWPVIKRSDGYKTGRVSKRSSNIHTWETF